MPYLLLTLSKAGKWSKILLKKITNLKVLGLLEYKSIFK